MLHDERNGNMQTENPVKSKAPDALSVMVTFV